jgi:RNA polymerase sigma factor (sigma-70 family)
VSPAWPPPVREDDASLLTRAAAGDDAAFEVLYHRHRGAVERVCARFGPPGAAGDLAHDVFVKLLHHGGALDRPELVGHWLVRVARNTALHASQRLSTVREQPVAAVTDAVAAQGDDVAGVVDRMAAASVLAALSTGDSRLLSDHYLADVPLAELARRHGTTAEAVKVRLHRARRRARAIAIAKGVRAGLPWPAAQRLRRWLPDVGRADGNIAAALLGPGLIATAVAIGATAPPPVTTSPAAAGDAPHAATDNRHVRPEGSGDPPRTPAALLDRDARSGPAMADVPGGAPRAPVAEAEGMARDPVAPPASAPVLGPITSAPSEPAHTEVGIRTTVSGTEHEPLAVEFVDGAQEEPGPVEEPPVVADTACAAFATAPDPAYCERR